MNKKLSILYILDILKEHSDENHPLTQKEIAEKLNRIFSFECERKSVAKSIQSLIDFGYDIIKLEDGGCYLGKRDFEPGEIQFLIDAVLASKNIPAKHASDLANKINKFQSKYAQKFYRYIFRASEITRTINSAFFLNIEIINEAIDTGKKIEFIYNFYDANKKLVPRREKPYVINPYFMLNSSGKYYLVCNLDSKDNISNYRLDCMTDVKILDEQVKPVTALPGYEKGLDATKYANENTIMFGDSSIRATLKLSDKESISNVIDWFGRDVRIYQKKSGDKIETFADITVSEMSIINWSMQYAHRVELVSPQSTREKIAEMAENMAEKYRK